MVLIAKETRYRLVAKTNPTPAASTADRKLTYGFGGLVDFSRSAGRGSWAAMAGGLSRKINDYASAPPLEHVVQGHAPECVPSQMTRAAKPRNEKRLLVIGMVHFRFIGAANGAGLCMNGPAPFIDTGERAGDIAPRVRVIHLVDFTPFPHVGGMAFEAVSTHPFMGLATLGATEVSARGSDSGSSDRRAVQCFMNVSIHPALKGRHRKHQPANSPNAIGAAVQRWAPNTMTSTAETGA